MPKPATTVAPRFTASPKVDQRHFKGTRDEVAAVIMGCEFPATWGDVAAVRSYACSHIPAGEGWHGVITITGYRTPPNDNGTGTTYLSVRWEPEHKQKGD